MLQMDIKPIRTKVQHQAALNAAASLMAAKANSPEGYRLEVLVTLIEAYERKHCSMDQPSIAQQASNGARSR